MTETAAVVAERRHAASSRTSNHHDDAKTLERDRDNAGTPKQSNHYPQQSSTRRERTSSVGSSSLNKYLNHNAPSRTNQIEPVRQNRKKSTQDDDDSRVIQDDQRVSAEENQINIVLNSQKFQNLGSQLLQETQTEVGLDAPSVSMMTAAGVQNPTSYDATADDDNLPRFGTTADEAQTPQTSLLNKAGPEGGLKSPQRAATTATNIEKIMHELNPALTNGPIQSPNVGLLMQQEDHQLLELYQKQTQELMRIANESTKDVAQAQQQFQSQGMMVRTGGNEMVDGGTNQQASQINMPELNYSDEPYLHGDEASSRQQAVMTTETLMGKWPTLPSQKQQTQNLSQVRPKLAQSTLLGLQKQFSVGGTSRFADSKQTIHGPDHNPGGKSDNPNSQNTLFNGHLQQITMPAAAAFDQNTNTDHGSTTEYAVIKDEEDAAETDVTGLYRIARESQSKLILGMVDVNKSHVQSTEPSSPVRLQSKIAAKSQLESNKRLCKMPMPQKPAMVQKNYVGGGVGKYSVKDESLKRSKKDNEATFPAFFAKPVVTKQTLTLDVDNSKQRTPQIVKHRGKSDIAFQRGSIRLNSQEESLQKMEIFQDNQPQHAALYLYEASQNSAASQNNEQGVGGRIVLQSKKNSQIRVQSVLGPPNGELTDQTTSLSRIDQRTPSLMNHYSNYKVSYLNKHSPTQLTQSSVNSASLQNLGSITEGGIIVAINQDSKMSFKEYVELTHVHPAVNYSGNITIEDSKRENTRQSSKTNEEIFHLAIPTLGNVPKLQALMPKKLLQTTTKAHQQTQPDQPQRDKKFKPILNNSSTERVKRHNRNRSILLTENGQNSEISATATNNKILKQSRMRSLMNQTTRGGGFHSPKKPQKVALMPQGMSTFQGRTSSSLGIKPDLEVTVFKIDADNSVAMAKDADLVAGQKTMHFGGKFCVDISKRASTITAAETTDHDTKRRSLFAKGKRAKNKSIDRSSESPPSPTKGIITTPLIKPKYFAKIQMMDTRRKQPQHHENEQAFPSQKRLEAFDPNEIKYKASPQTQMVTKDPVFLQTMQASGTKDPKLLSTMDDFNKMSLTGGPKAFGTQKNTQPQTQRDHHFYAGPWVRQKSTKKQPMITAQHIIKKQISPYHKRTRKSLKSSVDTSGSPKRHLREQSDTEQAGNNEMVLGKKKEIFQESPRSLLANSKKKLQLPELNNNCSVKHTKESKKNTMVSKNFMKRGSDRDRGSNVDLVAVTVDDAFQAKMMGIPERTEIDSILSPEFMTLVQQSSDFAQMPDHMPNFVPQGVAAPSQIETEGQISPKQERRQVIKILDQAKWNAAIVPSDQQVSLNTTTGEQMMAIQLQHNGSKVHTASTADQKTGSKRRQLQAGNIMQQDIQHVLNDRRIFENQSAINRLSPLGMHDKSNNDTLTITNIQSVSGVDKRTKSSLSKGIEAPGQNSLSSNTSNKDGGQLAGLLIEETEKEMNEIMASQMLINGGDSMRDDGISNARLGVSAIFEAEEVNHQMNSTEFSQFIKHKESIDGASSTKQDFAGQIQAMDCDHLYQTVGNDNSPAYVASSDLRGKMQPKMQQFPPSIIKKKNETQYPVSFHTRTNLPAPLEKLKAAQNLQMRKHMFNQTTMFPDATKRRNFDQYRTRSLVQGGGGVESQSRNTKFSMTTTRFSQHQRALSELRSFQQQLHIEASEISPPRINLPSTKQTQMMAVQETLSVRKQPWVKKSISPQRQRQIQEREARLEQLRLKQEKLMLIQLKEKRKMEKDNPKIVSNTDLKSVKYSIEFQSGRDLSTHMDVNEAEGRSRTHTPLGDISQKSQPQSTSPTKQVIVNTSTGQNTAYLPSPAQIASPTNGQVSEQRRISLPHTFALQQKTGFGPVLIDKSVLPQGRSYKNRSAVNEGDLKIVTERGGKRGIGSKDKRSPSFQKQQTQNNNEDSPKSYKMPANFPHHNNDSQLDSVQGPESINDETGGGSKTSPRMPVHSFTQSPIKTTHSSQVNHRRKIIADSSGGGKAFSKGQGKMKDFERSETVTRGKTLRIKDANVTAFPDDLKNNQKTALSLEDSNNEMPERYYANENDSIQNINQVQDLLDIVEKEVGSKQQNIRGQDGDDDINLSPGHEIDTMLNSQLGNISAIKSQLEVNSNSDGPEGSKSPSIGKKATIGRNALLSSAQTLEGDQNVIGGKISQD